MEDIKETEYDFYFTALGYEKRCCFFSSTYNIKAEKKYAFSFGFSEELSYDNNLKWFKGKNFFIEKCSDDDFDVKVKELLVDTKNIKILIDISSFSRLRIAILMRELNFASVDTEILVDFVYSIAKFTKPVSGLSIIMSASPILADFAGWPKDPIIPSSCIIGLGYDEGMAIGAIEYLEAGKIWLFRPNGVDNRFLKALNKANSELLEQVSPAQIIDYDLKDPISIYIILHSLAEGAIKESRPVILPFGPKIFTVLSIATAMNFYPDLSVWRISSGVSEQPVDREACGTICQIRSSFSSI